MEDMFKYTFEEVKNEAIIQENLSFYYYILQDGVTIFLQFIGSVICLNIGFIFFNYKVSFSNIIKLVLRSFLAIFIIQLLIIGIIKTSDMTFTTGTIVSVTERFNLINYIDSDSIASWLVLPLSTINVTQLLIVLILILSIRSLINVNLYKSFAFTIKTYGAGMLLWFVFAMIMEMNFS